MQRHRHQEFIRFLNELERDIPAGKVVHVVLDNYATHKHAKVRVWLERHLDLDARFLSERSRDMTMCLIRP